MKVPLPVTISLLLMGAMQVHQIHQRRVAFTIKPVRNASRPKVLG